MEGRPILRRSGVFAHRPLLAGILALTVLVVGFGTAIVLASLRKDKESEGRERGALLASLSSHAAVMERALATAEEEGATLRALSGGDLATVHRRFGARLNNGFGFEFVYITDAKGNIVYSSERGQLGEKRAYEWIRPAIARALAEGQKAAHSGLVAGEGAAGLMVLRPFEEKATSLSVPQPLIAVTVDVIDPDFLKEVSKPSSLQDVQLVQPPQQAVTGRRVFVPNLSDGSEVELVWRGAEPGRGLLRELMPVATVFALLLAGIFLVLMVRAQRTVTALAASEMRVRELAQQDYLTGLVNRGHFLSELDAALAARKDGETLALLFVDLDGFKEINDGAGHGAGDEILRAVARLLREAVGENGLAGRFGGDEFVVLARLAMPGDLDALVARIFRELDTPVRVEGEDVRVSASVGAARAPDDANSAEELMRLADVALYRAKAEGGGAFRLFEPRFESEQADRRQIAIDLAAALDRGELKLLFQPQVELASEQITGFEALVRWDHPTFGRLQPSEFIPVAEDSHLITALDIHVLRRACLEAHSLGGTTLAVNMSPVTLRTNGILQRIMDTLRETGFDPLRLEIEITESAVLQPSAEVQRTLEGLRAAGVRLALDDFGTGYASVVHVRRFPITKIKIDKSFIFRLGEDRDAAAIVEYKVRLGRSLGLVLTAEGVETRDQLRFLRAIGTDEGQGYLFAPPLPLAAAVAMLERQADAPSRAVGETPSLS